MSRIYILILIFIVSSIIAYFNGKKADKEGYSFTKTFIFTLIGLFGLLFFVAKFLTDK